MIRWMLTAATVAAVVGSAATTASAQTSGLSIEPYLGAFADAYDISPDGSDAAVAAGLRLAVPVGDRLRGVGNLGWAKSSDVSNPNGLPSYWVYDNEWAMTTAGVELDAISGRTSVALGLQVGAGWRRIDVDGKVGEPTQESEVYGGHGFSAIDVVVPEISVRHRITNRTSIRLGLQDQIFDFLEGPVDHSPGFSLGISLR